MNVEKPTALDLLSAARRTRETVEDFNAMLTYFPEEGAPVLGLLQPEEPAELTIVMVRALTQVQREYGPARWIAFTADTYVLTADDPTPNEMEPGGLAKAFAEGDPRVREQMTVLLVHADGSVEAANQTYRYTPADGWEWDEPMTPTGSRGRVLEALRQFT